MHFNASLNHNIDAGTDSFQVTDLTDDNDISYTRFINRTKSYHDLEELRNDIAVSLNLKITNVFIDEI